MDQHWPRPCDPSPPPSSLAHLTWLLRSRRIAMCMHVYQSCNVKICSYNYAVFNQYHMLRNALFVLSINIFHANWMTVAIWTSLPGNDDTRVTLYACYIVWLPFGSSLHVHNTAHHHWRKYTWMILKYIILIIYQFVLLHKLKMCMSYGWEGRWSSLRIT